MLKRQTKQYNQKWPILPWLATAYDQQIHIKPLWQQQKNHAHTGFGQFEYGADVMFISSCLVFTFVHFPLCPGLNKIGR